MGQRCAPKSATQYTVTVVRKFCKTMLTEKELEVRRTIWTELSDFYLDTELADADLKRKADVFKKSGLSIDKIKKINYYEVGPQLVNNLRSTAGVWEGFDQQWLHDVLEKRTRKDRGRPRNIIRRLIDHFDRKAIDYYTARYFEKIDDYLSEW